MPEKMSGKERVLAAINLKQPDRTPCNVSPSHFVARLSGVTIAEYMQNARLSMELNHRIFEELGGVDYVQLMPASMNNPVAGFASMPMKMKVPGVDLPPDSIPQYEECELMTVSDYDTIISKGWAKFVAEDLLPRTYPGANSSSPPAEKENMYEAEQDRRFYEDRGVFVHSGGPATPPCELFSFARSMSQFAADLYRRPDKVIAAMDAIFQELIDVGLSGIATPGAPVTIAASRCSNTFLSPRQFEKFGFPYLKKMVEMYVDRGSPVFFHMDTDWTGFLPYFRQFPEGVYLSHFDGMTNMFKAKELLGDRMAFMGDVPAPLLSLGTSTEVADYCRKLIDVVCNGGGLILNAGCGIPVNARFENIKAMVDTARNYPP